MENMQTYFQILSNFNLVFKGFYSTFESYPRANKIKYKTSQKASPKVLIMFNKVFHLKPSLNN